MEFYRITIYGDPVNVLFSGKFYFFHHSYYGLIAVVERTEESVRTLGKDCPQKFVVYLGNHHCDGSHMTENVLFRAVTSHVCDWEQKFVPKTCQFVVQNRDLANDFVYMEYAKH